MGGVSLKFKVRSNTDVGGVRLGSDVVDAH